MEHPTSGSIAASVALLDRCVARDAEALAELYDRTSAPVYRLCLYVLGTTAAAEKAAAETYEAAWREAESFANQRFSLDTWVLIIARRTARAVEA